jgi:cellulose synthase/poly-beta-1,6-N-acetylglucosamine synthase-like glycosyltransferase
MFEWVPTVWLSFNRKSLLIVKVFSSPAIWLIWWNNFLANFFSVHTSEIQIHFF